MRRQLIKRRWLAWGSLAVFGVVAAIAAANALGAGSGRYTVHNLNSNVPGAATHTDSDLKNGWGIAEPASGPWWVADNGTGKSTFYSADGTKQTLNIGGVSVPSVNVGDAPTGAVFNGGSSFMVTNGTASGPARFIFSSETGTIAGWAPGVDPANAIVAVPASSAVYKGLAIASTDAGPRLYATDFHNGRVDVFGPDFAPAPAPAGFDDSRLPRGYAPFGIQVIGNTIVVTYAKQEPGSDDESAGQGRGIVDEFDTAGNLISRIATHGQLNAPWGVALAPQGFGPFSGDLLVGNFGDGEINAYAKTGGSWERVGGLRDASGHAISIEGLWGIGFGNGGTAGPTTTLYFAAGPNDEEDGLFGSITAD